MSIAFIDSFTINPIENQTLEAGLKVFAQASRRESGCIRDDVSASLDKRGPYFIEEPYMSEKDYLSYREQQQIQDFRPIAANYSKSFQLSYVVSKPDR